MCVEADGHRRKVKFAGQVQARCSPSAGLLAVPLMAERLMVEHLRAVPLMTGPLLAESWA